MNDELKEALTAVIKRRTEMQQTVDQRNQLNDQITEIQRSLVDEEKLAVRLINQLSATVGINPHVMFGGHLFSVGNYSSHDVSGLNVERAPIQIT